MNDLRLTISDEPCERQAGSFLVRVWREPNGSPETPGPVRCFVRDLKTGREESLGDVQDLVALLVATVDEGERVICALPSETPMV